jgi:hypothetical protein
VPSAGAVFGRDLELRPPWVAELICSGFGFLLSTLLMACPEILEAPIEVVSEPLSVETSSSKGVGNVTSGNTNPAAIKVRKSSSSLHQDFVRAI